MKTIEELSYNSFYNMDNYKQITIDCIQDFEDCEIETEYNSLMYKVSTLLDVIDKSLEVDKKALELLISLITEKQNEFNLIESKI